MHSHMLCISGAVNGLSKLCNNCVVPPSLSSNAPLMLSAGDRSVTDVFTQGTYRYIHAR